MFSVYITQNKTLLLEAVIKCPNAKVVDMIMSKGADVDKEELQIILNKLLKK